MSNSHVFVGRSGVLAAIDVLHRQRWQKRAMTSAFHQDPREFLSDKQKLRLFAERKGRCHKCDHKLRSGERWIVEHVIALQNGGSNDWENLAITCFLCFPKKNAEDAAKAAKGRDVAVSCYLPSDQKQKKGRPLPGTKRSGWKHRMDGTWEKRG